MPKDPKELLRRGADVAKKAAGKAFAKNRRRETSERGRVDVSTTAERIRERRAAEAALLRIKDSPGYNIEVREPDTPGNAKLNTSCMADEFDSTKHHADPTIP